MQGNQVQKRSWVKWGFPLVAGGLLAWWWIAESAPEAPEPAPSSMLARPAVQPSTHPVATAGSAAIIPGGFVAPMLEDATPLELEQMREAEVARSAQSAEPPKSFVGADGRQHPFQYNGSAQSGATEQAREVRRKLLMQQLRADPVGFAKANSLVAKEVQWILDGSEDFPERLLD